MSVLHSFREIIRRKKDLENRLTQPQLTMIAIGRSIGTGLFLGCGAEIQLPRANVILRYENRRSGGTPFDSLPWRNGSGPPYNRFVRRLRNTYPGECMRFLVRCAYWVSAVPVIAAELTKGKSSPLYPAQAFPKRSSTASPKTAPRRANS